MRSQEGNDPKMLCSLLSEIPVPVLSLGRKGRRERIKPISAFLVQVLRSSMSRREQRVGDLPGFGDLHTSLSAQRSTPDYSG